MAAARLPVIRPEAIVCGRINKTLRVITSLRRVTYTDLSFAMKIPYSPLRTDLNFELDDGRVHEELNKKIESLNRPYKSSNGPLNFLGNAGYVAGNSFKFAAKSAKFASSSLGDYKKWMLFGGGAATLYGAWDLFSTSSLGISDLMRFQCQNGVAAAYSGFYPKVLSKIGDNLDCLAEATKGVTFRHTIGASMHEEMDHLTTQQIERPRELLDFIKNNIDEINSSYLEKGVNCISYVAPLIDLLKSLDKRDEKFVQLGRAALRRLADLTDTCSQDEYDSLGRFLDSLLNPSFQHTFGSGDLADLFKMDFLSNKRQASLMVCLAASSGEKTLGDGTMREDVQCYSNRAQLADRFATAPECATAVVDKIEDVLQKRPRYNDSQSLAILAEVARTANSAINMRLGESPSVTEILNAKVDTNSDIKKVVLK
ncbi:hypothetical protein AWB78_08418 [Caballeronia calidae]|uniref:Uncharacterized protein n=1 Tax=Caballeronia calidae TaxID=1777139 RepID=A0A158EK08_9BURK|nr:hypothetical protein [Caballeronia calidae]SAL07103.1 hypothetical protein AWB78_08418 [Caballeronia calidae]